jgi:hypothetical protein
MPIHSRWRIHVVLLMFILLLGGGIALRPGTIPTEKEPLLKVDLASIQQLVLENGERMRFERKEGVWRLVEPFAAPVNQTRIEQLLTLSMGVPADQYPLSESADLKNYGLAPPFATLDLEGRKLEFGDVAPLDRRRYVKLDRILYLMDDGFSHQLVSKSTDFIDKKLIPETGVIREIRIPGLKVTRTPEGRWQSNGALTPDQLQDFVMQWTSARAIEVRRGVPVTPGEVIDIETATGPIHWVILQKNPELILGQREENLLYVMTAESSRMLLNLPRLEKDPRTLLEKPLSSRKSGEVEEPGDHDHDHEDEE